jgi:hypothetical protein
MWSASHQKRVLATLVLSFVAALSLLGQAQTSANDWAWREKPQPLQTAKTDTVSPATRAARDKFFDRLYGPLPKGTFSDGPDVGPIFQDIPTDKSLTAAVVQFADYTTIRSARRRSIYTEVRMNVEQVLRDPLGTVQPGTALTVILGGGSLRLPSGQIMRENLNQGSESGIQPGYRYLAFLYHYSAGDYFDCVKTWDLSSGVAVPTYPFDKLNAVNGTSRFAGMPEGQFIDAVRGILSSEAK